MYAADELYDTSELEQPDADDCVDDGEGYCERHGGALLASEDECSRLIADTWLREGLPEFNGAFG